MNRYERHRSNHALLTTVLSSTVEASNPRFGSTYPTRIVEVNSNLHESIRFKFPKELTSGPGMGKHEIVLRLSFPVFRHGIPSPQLSEDR